VRLADVIILYKEFPHTDVVDRAEDLLDIVLKTLRGQARPVMSMYDCRQIGSYPTTLPLMRAFVDKIKTMEGKDGVLSISIGHCFPYADVTELGGRILVIMDKDKTKGDALAAAIGQEFVSMRGKTMPTYFGVDEGITAALETNESPVVMADPADNAGGGAPSDNTTILRRLIEREAREAAVGPLWDPIAVRLCFRRSHRRPCQGDRSQARLLAELRADPGAARRLRGRADRRHRCRADQQPHAGAWPRALHQSWHRSPRQESGGREVDEPFHGGLWPDRQAGDLHRFRWPSQPRLSKNPLYQGGAADLAARRKFTSEPDPLREDGCGPTGQVT